MSRGLSSAIKTQLASSSFVMAHLVKLEFNTTYKYTDFSSDIDVGSTEVTKTDCTLSSGSPDVSIASSGTSDVAVGWSVTGTGIADNTTIGSIYSSGNGVVLTNNPTSNFGSSKTLVFTEPAEIYSANGFLQSMGSINESSKLTIGSIDLVLSGVNQTLISDLLNNGHLNKKVTIQRAYINSSTNALIEAFSIFSGRVDGMQIRDTNETSEIGLTVSNHWSDFGRRSGRRTISSSQQQFFPDDKGFDFITKANLN